MPLLLDNNPNDEIGSKDYPFKLVIIGGGPSGCSVIVRAARTNKIDTLLTPDTANHLAGVCLIDHCSAERLGGGRLQDYAINSNTFANKFASNVLDDKQDTLPPESCVTTCFEKLKSSVHCKQLEEYGSKQGSLKVVGKFLCDVGQAVRETIAQYPTSSSCLTDTNVDAVQRYQRSDGLIGWRLSITENGNNSKNDRNDKNGDSERNSRNSGKNGVKRFVYAKDVLFATGGRQVTPTLSNSSHNSKVIGR